MDVYHRYIGDPNNARNLSDLGYKAPDAVKDEIDKLFAGYATEVLFGERRFAPCNAWRSERIQLDQDKEALPRFANRVHLFEESHVARGEDISMKFGRYLGYVSLRPIDRDPQSYLQYVAVANVTMPRFMLRPRYHVITCVGGPADGVLPFRCAPFCFPFDETSNRASCLHAAVHEAMLLKMHSFGFAPINSQDMVATLWEMRSGKTTMTSLSKRGASLSQALDLLRSTSVGAGGLLETISFRSMQLDPNDPDAEAEVKLEAYRCLTDYLANGMPLIVELIGGRRRSHAVLMLGMHLLHNPEEIEGLLPTRFTFASRVDIAELPGRFVVHDIIRGPFTEKRAADLLKQMWKSDKKPPYSGISFLAIAPKQAHLGIHDVRRLAGQFSALQSAGFWQNYLSQHFPAFGTRMPQASDLRYVTRLLLRDQVMQRYFNSGNNHLAHPARTQADQKKIEKAHSIWADNAATESAYWWSIEVYVAASYKGEADDVHADAGGQMDPVALVGGLSASSSSPPVLVFLWSVTDVPDADLTAGPQPHTMIRYTGRKTPRTVEMILRQADAAVRTEYEFEPQSA